jgi:Acyl-CoA carboxylase epsilon subunit
VSDTGNFTGAAEPLGLRIISGDPTAQELAAVTAVISGIVEELADARDMEAPATGSQWGSRASGLRQYVAAGAGAWNNFGQ